MNKTVNLSIIHNHLIGQTSLFTNILKHLVDILGNVLIRILVERPMIRSAQFSCFRGEDEATDMWLAYISIQTGSGGNSQSDSCQR